MKVPNLPGVYALKAHNQRLIYIGSTNNLSKRKAVHLYNIKNNLIGKGCKSIIDAFINGDYITFEVIEVCDNYIEREQHWINIYKLDNSFKIVNQFGAIREGSSSTQDFKDKMSAIRKEKWKDPIYRATMLEKIKTTQMTAERLNKTVYQFSISGKFIKKYISAKDAAQTLNLSAISLAAAARGNYMKSFVYKNMIFIYEGVLYKLDELLETHLELRAISSEAWERWKSTMNVQRLMSEQAKQ